MSSTHVQQLPSFAQAFPREHSGMVVPPTNSLAPIYAGDRTQSPDRIPIPSKKRTRAQTEATIEERASSVHVKQEESEDRLEQQKPPADSIPAASSANPPYKKRRMTVTGAPQLLDTDVQAPKSDHSSSTPISPVVMGFTIMRDDPNAMEQVRSMLTVKQKQKAIIEGRRSSVAGIVTVNTPTITMVQPTPPEERSPSSVPPPPMRANRRSPNATSNRRNTNAGSSRQPSPPATNQIQPQLPTLPPGQPPMSLSLRKFGGGKRRPADIMISPREAHAPELLHPVIQSAPPIPQAGGQPGQFPGGRFPMMALPRIPSVLGPGEGTRRTASTQVPPTPTRLSMQRSLGSSAPQAIAGISGRSPPASIPIASTLVPPTPSSLQRPGYSGEKSAFLAPFEALYDTLADSRQMKSWLNEQLQKSNALMQTLTQQQEKMDEMVETLVDRKVGVMREEMTGLHRRVEELEEALRVARYDNSGRRGSATEFSKLKGMFPIRNGIPPVPLEAYTFPPVDSRQRRPEPPRGGGASPAWRHEQHGPEPGERRSSLSATRLEVPPSSNLRPPLQSSGSGHRVNSSTAQPSRSPRQGPMRGASPAERHSPPLHRKISEPRRNSLAMSPPSPPRSRPNSSPNDER